MDFWAQVLTVIASTLAAIVSYDQIQERRRSGRRQKIGEPNVFELLARAEAGQRRYLVLTAIAVVVLFCGAYALFKSNRDSQRAIWKANAELLAEVTPDEHPSPLLVESTSDDHQKLFRTKVDPHSFKIVEEPKPSLPKYYTRSFALRALRQVRFPKGGILEERRLALMNSVQERPKVGPLEENVLTLVTFTPEMTSSLEYLREYAHDRCRELGVTIETK